MEPRATKKRSKNFTQEETTVLVEEVEKRRGILFGPLKGATLTQTHRERAWERVTEAVNAVAPARRSTDKLKKKFKDLKMRTKQKANAVKREGRKTGGGSNNANVPLNAVESKLIQFIGSDSIEGIVGGVDTFRESLVNQPSTSSVTVREPIPTNGSVEMIKPTCYFPPSQTITKTLKNVEEISVSKSNPTPASIPNVPKRGKKRTKTLALDEIKKTTDLQRETNNLLRELVTEFKSFKEQFLNIKKLELELLNEKIEIKRKKMD